MKNKIYLRTIFRDIKQSFGRFVAITVIILLGVLLFVGIKAIGPDLQQTADHYFDTYHLADVQIVSTGGLTDTDKKLAQTSSSAATVEMGFSQAVSDETHNATVQVTSYDANGKLNRLQVVSGRLPKAADEIVIDEEGKKFGLKLGDTYTIAADTLELARTDFKVVGFVQSPGLIDRRVKGSTTLGSGSLDFFVAIPLANFTSDTYSAMNVGYANLTAKNSFLDPYLDAMDDNADQLTKKFSGRATARLSELQKIANNKIAPQEAELATGQTQLTEGQNQLQTAQTTLDEQKATLTEQKKQLTAAYGEAAATAQLTEATAQLAAAQASLDEQKATLATKQTELDEGKQKIADAKAEVDSLKTPTYYFNLRADNPGYAEYAALTDQINAIANIFPVFFFLIAILITFTTMTRMIEENRREIGTLKALGYHKLEIAQKYLLYAFLATILGVTCGVLIGSNALPYIAYAMFKEHYIFGNLQLNYQWLFIFLATLASLLATIGALAYILTKELREKPADLMLAKAPKGGQRIFLEYFKRLWARLSFNQKVSYRNLFRYKARMVVTVIGIAGCTGLMLAGFGLKESIQAPGTRQLNGITDYQALITLTDDHEDLAKIETFLTDEAQIKSELAVYQQQLTVKKTGVATQPVSLIVPSDTKALAQFIHADCKIKLDN